MSKGVNINRGEPQTLDSTGLHPLGMGGMADPKKHAPPHVLPCQTWTFGVKGCTGVGINRKEPKNWGVLEPSSCGVPDA